MKMRIQLPEPMGRAKVVLGWNFLAMSSHLRNLKRSQICNLIIHIKLRKNKNNPTFNVVDMKKLYKLGQKSIN
jgi:hypothetical protein